MSTSAGPRRYVRLLCTRALPLVALAVVASGCKLSRFGMPEPITQQADIVLHLWQGFVISGLALGVFVWGLIFYAVIVFRKRTDQVPRQVKYNIPIEVLYTVVPFVLVGVLFYYTAKDEVYEDRLTRNPNVVIGVVGFRWNWQFRYVSDSLPGHPIVVTGQPNDEAVLVLPEDRTIRFLESSPDVEHSFFVPAFLFKRDVIPGRVNQFQITINKLGIYPGQCALLCGVDHDQMIFKVDVITPAAYSRYIGLMQAAANSPTLASGTGATALHLAALASAATSTSGSAS